MSSPEDLTRMSRFLCIAVMLMSASSISTSSMSSPFLNVTFVEVDDGLMPPLNLARWISLQRASASRSLCVLMANERPSSDLTTLIASPLHQS